MPTMQELVRQELLKILVQGQKDIATPTSPPYAGYGGAFDLPGVNREFISLVITPQGLFGELPAVPSMFVNPEFGYITGFGDLTGSKAAGICDDARIPGGIVTCIQTAHFGRYRLDTDPLELNSVGLLTNRATPVDFTLLNGPLAPMLNVGMNQGQPAYFNPRMEMVSRMSDVARAMGEILYRQLWEGDPANKTGGGGEDEFPGLDILVGTTKIDARTGTPCEALASDIKDFGNRDITLNNGLDFYNALYYMVQTRKFIAKRANMGEVVWNIAMREAAWNEFAKVWPCIAAVYGCIPGSAQPVISLDNQAALRQQMLDNPQITIAGTTIRVVIDDALPEEDLGGGCYSSDIWLLSRSVKGGRSVLYREYLDYNQGAMPAAEQAGYGPTFRTDGGQYFWWTKPNNNVCVQLGVKTEQRVILLTPHLCGRLLNVKYCALQHAPDAYSDQDYYNRTGESNRGTPAALYSDWNASGPGIH